jgi:ligand-binding sensor domain-containing protein
MDSAKNHPAAVRALICSVCLLLLLASAARAVEFETYTSFGNVRSTAVINDTVFLATSGGLLAVQNPAEAGAQFVNADGLGTVDLTDIIEDADGVRWITAQGRLVRQADGQFESFLTLPVYGDVRLLTAADDGDQLWIGSDSGLVLFSKINDNGQFENRFRITSVNPFPPVYDIAIGGDSIWLATANGIAVGNRTDPRALTSPLAWTVYSAAALPALGVDRVDRFADYRGMLYAGNSNGLFQIDTSGGAVSAIVDPVVGSAAIKDLVVNNDSLFIYSTGGVAVIAGSATVQLSLGVLPAFPNTGANANGVRWLGLSNNTIYVGTGAGAANYPFIGLPENVVADVTVTPNGDVFALFDSRGVGRLTDSQWDLAELDLGGRGTKIISDSSGAVWAGTFGRGVYRITSGAITRYDDTNSPIRRHRVSANGVIISGLSANRRNVFISVLEPSDGYSVAIASLQGGSIAAWDSLGRNEGLTEDLVISLAASSSRLAAGADNNGVFVYPDSLGRDVFEHYLEVNTGLISNVTRVVRYAPDGALWVGTNFGLSRFEIELGLTRFRDVDLPAGFGPDITALEFDSRGNGWVGARNGLARYDAETGAFEVYRTTNSGLVNNIVRGISIDPTTGDVYVATEEGLSRIITQLGPLVTDVDEVLAFPNPYVIRSSSDIVQFNFGRPGNLRIYTIAGELVYEEFRVNLRWNGLNQNGEPVASGTYLFVINDDDGNVSKGKFLLVRE